MNITLNPISVVDISIRLASDSPLIVHAWSQKSLDMLRMTAQERKARPKTKREPEQEALSARYLTQDGQDGISALALKTAILSAAHKDLGLPATTVRKAVFLKCDDPGLVLPIEFSEMILREDVVRVGVQQTDIRYRPEYRGWTVDAAFTLDQSLISVETFLTLVNRAGFGVGIGEWRPEKGGEFGRFHVDSGFPVKATSREV